MSERIVIGKIVAPIGIKGEIKVLTYSDDSSRFSRLEKLFIDGEEGPFAVEKARPLGTTAGVKLKGIDDRNRAESLRGRDVSIEEEDLEELPEGTYYVRDLVGLQVKDADTGKTVGTLTEVIQNTAQDVYRIELEGGAPDSLVPAVKEFIRSVDIKKGVMEIHFIPGMIENED